ncbi:MAG: GNAT family N-acetyltransferase [Planctomycetota bacterium]|jgi:putative acetyltransferase
MVNIRIESQEDVHQVHILNEQAFEQPAEANIVDKLRQKCPEYLSLVAEDGKNIVGHILFTPVVIEDTHRKIQGMGLAPMAVIPERQKQGIGSRLVEKGLKILKKQNCPFVIVLGHPEYYPRFGFERASTYGLISQWEGVPDEAFMVIAMDKTALEGISGVAKYRAEFDEAM